MFLSKIMNAASLSLSAIISMLFGSFSPAATIIKWHNSVGAELRDIAGVPLPEGPSRPNYSGTIVQLGYYSLATTVNPFAGEWITVSHGTIGEKSPDPLGDGRFNYAPIIGQSSLTIAVGTPLAIRFYDAKSVETSTYFNAVTSATGEWNWVESPVSTVTIDAFVTPTALLLWQGGQSSAFRTTLPIPEPAYLLLAGAAGTLAFGRKRRRS